MILVLLAIAVIIPWVMLPSTGDLCSLRQLSRLLRDLDAAARAGVVDPWRIISAKDAKAWPLLGGVIRQARRSGYCIVAGLSNLHRQVECGVRRAEHRAYLTQLFRMRLSLTICIAAMARFFLSQRGSLDSFRGDIYCVAAAAAATGLATRWFGCCLPRAWFCTQMAEVADWLDGYIRGAALGTMRAELITLCRREVREGVDLSKEKRRVLRTLARRRGDAERLQLRRVIEVLPLIEIFGFGLIAGLVLAGPALSAWHWTEPEGSATPGENLWGRE